MAFDINSLQTHQLSPFMALLGQLVQDDRMNPENAELAVDDVVALFEERVAQQTVHPEIATEFNATTLATRQIVDQHQAPIPVAHQVLAAPHLPPPNSYLEVKSPNYERSGA